MSDCHPVGGETLLDAPLLMRFDALLGEPDAGRALERLDRELAWQRPRLRLYGREHPIPRRQVWMGSPDAHYRYSGRDFTPAPWHPEVARIREAVIARLALAGLDVDFNSVLLNRYQGGGERMGWHSDDEPELGPEPLIAAVSLGAARPLRFRWKQREHEGFNAWLPHDSLLLMGPGVQRRLQHALLPRRIPGLRISLTFRRIAP
ncbi:MULTISPECIES: alpha-ketoglutarate-dependent dioxygenase AlkB family protein [Halomonas]|uniref:Alpha-ketoglutarate-dependent dioxygenase AlkB n=1 Tax=Halomonas flagellata TaxID=2920385 RepID=A0ABS9RSX2_9GAMM|nr:MULTISPECIES: alpha-ketoglutarate-dependent dioxygenase AlkB [Halomonas]MCH4562907.1 alpha-ketoglutarate-dependent dioxygenase AlkB [Halomonas flagellata]PXX95522.1 alpha-ketoglutarate-dependent dioxygenase AlkB [Halomonas sp. LBP4]